jgi:acyl-homoserine lactone acylase PvdQ
MIEREDGHRNQLNNSSLGREERQRNQEQIRKLQDNIFSLRMSRRVLMSLLEQVQASQQEEIDRLRKQNAQLTKQNQSFAGRLWEQNRRLCELERCRLE